MSKYYKTPYKYFKHIKTLYPFKDKEGKTYILIYSAEKDFRDCSKDCIFDKICKQSRHLKCMSFAYFKYDIISRTFTKSDKIEFLLHYTK